MKIIITLPLDRLILGSLSAFDDTGATLVDQAPCLGKSDEEFATLAGNPARDPLKRGGDLPYGEYLASYEKIWFDFDEADEHSYGPYGLFRLMPVSGDGVIAYRAIAAGGGGRSGVCLHSGPLNPAYTQWQGLRPTHGCARTLDAIMQALANRVSLGSPVGIACSVVPLAA